MASTTQRTRKNTTPATTTDTKETDVTTTTATTETETKTPKAPRFPAFDADRAAWVAAHARPAVSQCLCGCDGTTKGRFVPGHDATLKEHLKAGAAAGCESSKAALATFGW